MFKLNLNSIVKTTFFLSTVCATSVLKAADFKNLDEFNVVVEQDTDLMARAETVLLVTRVMSGNYIMVEHDIDRGMNVETETVNGLHLSHLAAYKGQLDVLKVLQKKGADFSAKDGRGFSVFEYAKFTAEILMTQLEKKDIKLLEDAVSTAEISAMRPEVNKLKLTICEYKSKTRPRIQGCIECAEYIKSLNVDVDQQKISSFQTYFNKDEAKEKAFSFIKDNKCVDLQKLLNENLVDINSQNEEYATLLICATQYNRLDIVQWLLQQPGVDINVKNYLDRTALGMAKIDGRSAVVEILKRFGATEV